MFWIHDSWLFLFFWFFLYTEFPTYLNFQRKIWLCLREFVANKEKTDFLVVDSDDWKKMEEQLFDKRNYYLKEILRNYETTFQISVVVSRLQGLFNQFFVRILTYYAYHIHTYLTKCDFCSYYKCVTFIE